VIQITCTVILLGDPARDGEGGSGGVYRRDEQAFDVPIKSKLWIISKSLHTWPLVTRLS